MVAPEVLVDVSHDMAVMTEETFGPVIPVMAYDSVDEVIEWANAGVYGLSAGVIAGSLEEAEAIGRRIDAGGISLNDGSLTAMVTRWKSTVSNSLAWVAREWGRPGTRVSFDARFSFVSTASLLPWPTSPKPMQLQKDKPHEYARRIARHQDRHRFLVS